MFNALRKKDTNDTYTKHMTDELLSVKEEIKNLQTPEPQFSLEVGHMKEGSISVLRIKSASVKGNNIYDVTENMRRLLVRFNEIIEESQ
tara:strand:+ start:1903 stop:2169 length:267 start_codon:yes stop_codon:yes gene_type:complete